MTTSTYLPETILEVYSCFVYQDKPIPSTWKPICFWWSETSILSRQKNPKKQPTGGEEEGHGEKEDEEPRDAPGPNGRLMQEVKDWLNASTTFCCGYGTITIVVGGFPVT